MRTKKKVLAVLLLALIFIATFGTPTLAAEEPTVYTMEIKSDIGSAATEYLARSLTAAAESDSTLLIVLDTYGGYVDAADEIKNTIISSGVPTICFVQDKALSAGSLIALSCDKIVMAPGATMGAAEPRIGEEKADNKVVSYWSAQLRSAAERNGRNGELAAAMADSDIVIDGVKEKGQLLTLTTQQALKMGMADFEANSIAEVLTVCGLEGATIEKIGQTGGEKAAEFLTSPVVAPILLSLGIGGLVLELFFAGFGVFGVVGIVSLALYFIGGFLLGTAGWLVIILFVAAILLLALEIFVTPGFGVLGVLGIVSLLAAIIMSSGSVLVAFWQILIALVVTVILVVISLKWGKTRRIWNKLILSDRTSTAAGYTSQTKGLESLLGQYGVAVTTLRPAGTALIDGKRIDVVTDGEYIGKDVRLVVIKVDSGRVVVKEA